MPQIRFSIIGNNMTSLIEGVGKKELQECIDKLQDGLPWYLVVKSKANFVQTTTNHGVNWATYQRRLYALGIMLFVLGFLLGRI